MADRKIEDAFEHYYALQEWLRAEELIVWDDDALQEWLRAEELIVWDDDLGWEVTGKGVQVCISLMIEVISKSAPQPPNMN